MSAPVVLVTGGNTGLGYEVIRTLLASPQAYRIALCCRTLAKGQAAVAQLAEDHADAKTAVVPVVLDIDNDESIASAAAAVAEAFGHVDVLVNNAGAQYEGQLRSGALSARDMWAKSWETNVTSTHLFTEAMMPLLFKGRNARLVFITSGLSTLAGTANTAVPVNRPPQAGWPKPPAPELPAYRSAKAGLNMLMREWTRRLALDPIEVYAVSPGLLATNLGGVGPEGLKKMGALDPSVGGELVRRVIAGERKADAGKVVSQAGVQEW